MCHKVGIELLFGRAFSHENQVCGWLKPARPVRWKPTPAAPREPHAPAVERSRGRGRGRGLHPCARPLVAGFSDVSETYLRPQRHCKQPAGLWLASPGVC